MLLSSGPSLTSAELLGILAFGADMFVGPASLAVIAVGMLLRRGWFLLFSVVGALNVLLATTMLATVGDGLDALLPLIVAQAILGAAVVGVGLRPAWRAYVFGARRDRGER